jgi:hypothetical protein
MSGVSLYAFTVPNIQKRERELYELAKFGLPTILKKEFSTAHETLNLKVAKLFMGKKISSGIIILRHHQ